MTNQEQVRKSFWVSFPEHKPEYRAKKRQNDYRCDIRCDFVNYVDALCKNGEISEKLAYRVTL
jgi:hypothetical protein